MRFGGNAITAVALAIAVGLVACAGTPATASDLPRRGELLWSADHETGDLSQWTTRRGGGPILTGDGEAWVEDVPFARSGAHVAALRIDTASGLAAARLFRWRDVPERAYFGAWLYFPREVRPDDWWNVMQVKSVDATGESVPTWVVNVKHDGSGMRLYLWDALQMRAYGTEVASASVALPIGTWVHLELYVHRHQHGGGRVALWQDGVLLYDVRGRTTAVSDELHWSVNNYSDATTPSEFTVYIDDATIHGVTGGRRGD